MSAGRFSWGSQRNRWGATKQSTDTSPPEVSTIHIANSPVIHDYVQELRENPLAIVAATSAKKGFMGLKSNEVMWLISCKCFDRHMELEVV